MKSFTDYLEESEYLAENPTVGDIFEIEIAREEIMLESYVVDVVEDGIVIEADDTIMRILMHVGYLTEDSHMPTAQDSIDPKHKEFNSQHSADDDLDEAEDNETMVSAYQDRATTSKNSNVSDEFTSRSFARNPATGTGSYHIKKQKDGEVSSDFQKNVRKPWMDYTEKGGQAPMTQFRATTNEAKYQGREVPLGKKMKGDVKKSKVYVRGPKGNVVKVNFGDPNMTIKKSNPKRRKSFRARHNCANPGPRWKARYWSCRSW